jgi:hypothetical protein
MTAPGAPPARAHHTAVWTGSQMIIWGGSNASTSLDNRPFIYTSGRVIYLYVHP